jgi:multiple sugar transport system substrate-binding protein
MYHFRSVILITVTIMSIVIVFISLTNFVYATVSTKNGTIELNIICNDFDESTAPSSNATLRSFDFIALVDNAVEELKTRHPDLNIEINYTEYQYAQTHQEITKALNNPNSQPDVICLDQIWLGEFAGKGLLTDLTENMTQWKRSSEWYQANLDGMQFNNRIYGIWAWTDIRGLWYWKDLLNEANVDPDLLKTWDGYIVAAKKLNENLKATGIEGVHLTGANHSPDLWYPYLWMLGGEILELRDGHPTNGTNWFPVFNSSKGVLALNFISNQIDAGIKPQVNHSWGEEFANREFAVMIEGSWMPSYFEDMQLSEFEKRIGFIPIFPVHLETNDTSSLMGGWELSIPKMASNKGLAWELITLLLNPKILAPWLEYSGFLPTQISIGQGYLLNKTLSSSPYYDEMISMIPFGGFRPSIPEYPQIAHSIKEALDAVYYGTKDPKEALDDAAAKSAVILGWNS